LAALKPILFQRWRESSQNFLQKSYEHFLFYFNLFYLFDFEEYNALTKLQSHIDKPLATLIVFSYNEEKSAASFCRQVAAWFTDVFCNFNLVKNHEIANNSTTTEAREKISTDLESSEFFCHFLMYV
jgi:hypothetical protein